MQRERERQDLIVCDMHYMIEKIVVSCFQAYADWRLIIHSHNEKNVCELLVQCIKWSLCC